MSYLTVEVEIDHGRVSSKGGESLPEKASGLLTILRPAPVDVNAPLPAAFWQRIREDWGNEPFERPPQGEFEKREEW